MRRGGRRMHREFVGSMDCGLRCVAHLAGRGATEFDERWKKLRDFSRSVQRRIHSS